ncbi:hypothetical protein ACFLU5_12395 [Bacteroidota bacterium]
MRKVSLVLIGIFFFQNFVSGQAVKLYELKNDNTFDRVNLTFKSGNSNTNVFPAINSGLNIYGKSGSETIDPVNSRLINRTHHIIVNEASDTRSNSRSITDLFFGDDNDNNFDLQLPADKPLQLNLTYAVGDAHVDLSDLAIEKLKINTGSADVFVTYTEGHNNLIEMDTFFVEVDMGSLTIDKMDLSRAQKVIADIGFGELTLTYTNEIKSTSHIQASIAAGNLLIQIPTNEIPVRISIHDSPLCQVKIPKSFNKIQNDTFVSPGYNSNSEEILDFDLNVGLGRIKFQSGE